MDEHEDKAHEKWCPSPEASVTWVLRSHSELSLIPIQPFESGSQESLPEDPILRALAISIQEYMLRQEFNLLATNWKRDTGHLSRISKKIAHPNYRAIVNLGSKAVPLILHDLKKSMSAWFWALTEITGDNPIPEKDSGNIRAMTEAWIQWAKIKGLDV